MTLYLQELLEGWVYDAPEISLSGISLDEHSMEAGDAYVAVQGQAGHGLDGVKAAVAAGAVVVIHDGLQALPDLDVPSVQVYDLANKLGELASRFYAAPSELMTVAGVTGTYGKDTITHYLSQSWQRAYGNAGMVGTLGHGSVGEIQSGERKIPDAIGLQQVLADCARSDMEYLAMEVSSADLQQRRVETVQFDAAIFTGLGRNYPDCHSDMADYARTKRLLFTDHAPSFAIINHDDSLGRQWINELDGGMQILNFGLQKGAELRAEIRSADSTGMTLHIDGPWGAECIHTGLLGEFNASGLLATAGTLVLMGMPWHQVLHQLEVMQPLTIRQSRPDGAEGQVAVTNNVRAHRAMEDAA
jgi:UDP-N-acetylmuramoyl-L-alanyl-D-glutamate--2,6-diaminopimelate ligase